MRLKGFVDTSFVDWDGKIVSTVFVPTCNLRCPFCFNHQLILHPEKYPDVPESAVTDFLKRNGDFVDGVCVSGGEPTTARGLKRFCQDIVSLGFKVKLDTNGTNPGALIELVSEGLVNYVAMDVKAPPDEKKYGLATGTRSPKVLESVKESVSFLIESGVDHEFRTTVVPSIHSDDDVEEIAKWLRGSRLYVLQKFQPERAWDRRLRKFHSQSDSEMERLASVASRHLGRVKWRGR
ncbi:MAG: anaerobic ribonucleoside-triphosphate reductase activating protein [Candidatus Brockarchaeota archaeon]|nr:anaerobic ribonucleoside-triphosphate reductase activating protein [Candidatus Brockarchaeota archaeon]